MKHPVDTPEVVSQLVTPRRTYAKVNAETVRRCKPTADRYELPDGRGLALVVHPTGKKTWVVRYRAKGTRQVQKLTLGDFPALTLAAARGMALEKLADVHKGHDPAKAKKQARIAATEAAETFGKVLDRYLLQHVSKLRSADEIERLLRKEFTAWTDKPLTDLNRRTIIAVLDAIGARAPVTAQRSYSHLRHMLGWCVDRELIATHPMIGMKRPDGNGNGGRDRVLSDSELRLVWNAAEIEPGPFQGNQHADAPTQLAAYAAIVRLLILTGCRRSEASELDWSEVDLDGRRLVIGRERMKAGAQHVVPLSDMALRLILDQPSASERSGPVFTPVTNWSRIKCRLDSKLPGTRAWVLHDIRRTCASGLQRLGVMPVVIEAVLGHAVGGDRGGGIRRIYQRYKYDREARAALEQWAAHIARVLSGKGTAELVALRRG